MTLLAGRRQILPVRQDVGDGEAVELSAHTVRTSTCSLCRSTARRWLSRGDVWRCRGDVEAWQDDAAAQGAVTLVCPGCAGILWLEPARTEGGTVQWLVTAFRSCGRVTQAAFLFGAAVVVVLLLGTSAQAQEPPPPAPVAPSVVVVSGVQGEALVLLTIVAGLTAATSAAQLIGSWHR